MCRKRSVDTIALGMFAAMHSLCAGSEQQRESEWEGRAAAAATPRLKFEWRSVLKGGRQGETDGETERERESMER